LVVWQSTQRTLAGCGVYTVSKCEYATGVQLAVLRWQVSQLRVVSMCFAGFAVAQLPLWQLAQFEAATAVCVKIAGSQELVRWQESQDSVVGRWLAGLVGAPPASEWQLVQSPGTTPTCVNGLVVPVVDPVVDPVPAPGRPGMRGRTPRPPVERSTRRATAAAAAPSNWFVLWQLMQSWVDLLPWWLPTVAVLSETPYQLAPLGPWQLLHVGVDDPDEPCVYFMNAPDVWLTLVPLNEVKTVVEWHSSQAGLLAPVVGTCRGESTLPPVVTSWVAVLETPYQMAPLLWQVAQPLEMFVCTIAVPGPNADVEVWQTLQSSAEGGGM
jgi:hypothetical protein